MKQTIEIRSEKSWVWLQNGDFKRDTESLIVAAQNQSIRTNLVKAKMKKTRKTCYVVCVKQLMKV